MNDSRVIVGVLLVGVALYLVTRGDMLPGATAPASWRDIIGTLPAVPKPEPKPDVGVVQGAVTGAGYGAVAGPWGAAVGAGAGAVASFFV
jgi:hypothetical protein